MPPSADILEANLSALRRTEPELAQRLADAAPAALDWAQARSGEATASVEYHGRPLWLASRYDPAAEARKLIESVDFQKHAAVVVLGVGLGHHVAELARDLGNETLLIVFEPDLPVLRAVLERMDHSWWLGRSNVVLADTLTDRAALLARLEGAVGFITQGMVLITHPPTRQCHGPALARFSDVMTDTASYARMHMATALVNASRTISNLTSALPWFAAGANTDELHQAAAGRPAVCVSAGPSLARNVDLLRDPAVRRNVVVICVQTALKVLLQHGVRPDFVTALDYSEISRRFYEDLPPLPGVTLVAEPKVHPAVLEVYPGPIRVTSNGFLSRLMAGLPVPSVPIRDGATVAHLSFYLAQHLGCDPIIITGQDLGFSDGLYYCPGTAIHDVWAPELGAFNTLEMMEWQRIVRHRNHLHKLTDVHGQPIYSDEQMLTYQKQFERDFAGVPQRVLDATEGGIGMAGADRITLAEALSQYATRPVPTMPAPREGFDADRLAAVADLMRRRIDETRELRQLSKDALPILKRMLRRQGDQKQMNKLFTKLNPIQKQVHELDGTFGVISELNTVGTFKRLRADRAINHPSVAGRQDVMERQRRQLERDAENVDWIIQACEEALPIFERALGRVTERLGRKPVRAMAAA
jgi:hypothetical protein